MARLLLDTNVIIRFLTGDHPTHSPRSRNLFARAAAGELTLVLTGLALAETAWVLQSFYSLDRAEIAAALKGVVESTGIEVQDKRILLSTLRNFAQTDVNFVDAYHAAVASAESIAIVSFDRDFDQFPGIKRIEPQSSH
jgi:predicted nucleic acid-binding protein